jgi:hypothetical protein
MSCFQLETDQMYEVVLTNCSGLYRYRTSDVIKVHGFCNECPIVEYLFRYIYPTPPTHPHKNKLVRLLLLVCFISLMCGRDAVVFSTHVLVFSPNSC